jgi:CDGSH-type Zn-finger protein
MSATKKLVSVTVSKDGPYIVSGGPPLTKQTIIANADGESVQWQEGETYDAPARYALCRCGHSHKAPFCDGTHEQIGFEGTETAERTPYSAQTTVFDGPASNAIALASPNPMRPCCPAVCAWRENFPRHKPAARWRRR